MLRTIFDKVNFLLRKVYFKFDNKSQNCSFDLINDEYLDAYHPILIKIRSTIKLEIRDKIRVAVKYFNKNPESHISLQNELKSYNLFNQYKWYPKVRECGLDFIAYEYINNKYRLDQQRKYLNHWDRENILNQIIDILLVLYQNGIAHRDIHIKNAYYIEGALILTDFEVIAELDSETDFFEGYDITGKWLESPLNSNNMCLLSDDKYSLRHIIKINNKDELRIAVNNRIIDQLKKNSESFFTRKDLSDSRHKVLTKKIYTTFNLKHTQIGPEYAQRNITDRIIQLQIKENDIKDQTILDLGAHTGGIVFEISKMKPKYTLGIEYDIEKTNLSKIIHALNCKSCPIEFICLDLESPEFILNFNKKFDIVLCLAVIGHIKNKEQFLAKVYEICNSILFLEGNGNTEFSELNDLLLKVGFRNIEYFGQSYDETKLINNNRPLFKALK